MVVARGLRESFALHTCMMRMCVVLTAHLCQKRTRRSERPVLVVEKIFARIQMFGY